MAITDPVLQPSITTPQPLPIPEQPLAPVLPSVMGQEELYQAPTTALGALEEARPPGTTTGQYVTPEATVSGQLMSLLGKDSPYLRQADVRAREGAQSRGLLSSSMAVGAAERERIKAALPIAQQDAQLFGTSALKEQAFADTSALASQEAAQRASLQRQGYTENISALGVQGDIQLRLEAYSQDAATQRSQMEMEFKADIANVEMEATTRQQYIASASDLGNQYNSDVGTILRSKDFASEGDRDRALIQIEQVYQNNMNFLSAASGVELDWSASGGGATTTGEGVLPAPGSDATGIAPPITGGVVGGVFGSEAQAQQATAEVAAATTGTVYEGLASKSYTDYNQFLTDFKQTGIYETDEYFNFTQNQVEVGKEQSGTTPSVDDITGAVSDVPTYSPTYAPTAQLKDIYTKVMYAALNPTNAEAQAGAIKATTYNNAPMTGLKVDPNTLPPSERENLPLWQQWVNTNL